MSDRRRRAALLLELCRTVPDGLVCFFPSYLYMEGIVAAWSRTDVLDRVAEHKLIFIETKDIVETTLALNNFRKACDSGRGAVRGRVQCAWLGLRRLTPYAPAQVFLSVARGKVAEGVDFDRHYGRCVVLIGASPCGIVCTHAWLAHLCALQACLSSTRCRACCAPGWSTCGSGTTCVRASS